MLSGESSSINHVEVGRWLSENASEILGSYTSEDIYKAEESGLFYRMLSKKTFTRKGEICRSSKQSKQRLMLLLCMNVDGSDKCDPLIIGKSVKQRCFKGSKKLSTEHTWNTKA